MSTHSYELEQARQPEPDAVMNPAGTSPQDSDADDDDDLMYDLIGAAVRGFHTPYHPV